MTNLRHTNIMEALGQIHSKMSCLETDIDWVKNEVGEIKSWLKHRDETTDKKYAPKWLVYPVITFVSLVMTAVIGALLGLVLIPPTQSAMILISNLV